MTTDADRPRLSGRMFWRRAWPWLAALGLAGIATQGAWLAVLAFALGWAWRGGVAQERCARACLAAPAVFFAYLGYWFVVVLFWLAWSWRSGDAGRRWRRRLLWPLLAILLVYYGAWLATVPASLARAEAIGAAICELALRGELHRITTESPPPGLANMGPSGAERLRRMQRFWGPGCTARVRPGSLTSFTRPGAYVLVVAATQELAAVSLNLYYHPIWTPLDSYIFDKYGPTEMTYGSYVSGDFGRKLLASAHPFR